MATPKLNSPHHIYTTEDRLENIREQVVKLDQLDRNNFYVYRSRFKKNDSLTELEINQMALAKALQLKAVRPKPTAKKEPQIEFRAPSKGFSWPSLDEAKAWVGYRKYSIYKYIFYAALVPTSAQAVHKFMEDLNLYGHSSANFAVSLILTIAVDLLGIDLLTRAFKNLRAWGIAAGVSQLTAAAFIIGANIALTFLNLSNNAQVQEKERRLSEWAVSIAEKQSTVEKTRKDLSSAQIDYLLAKWKGSPSPEKCEMDNNGCKGPFLKASEALYSSAYSAKTSHEAAIEDLKKFEALKPSDNVEGSKGDLNLKLYFYLILWGLILITVLAAPVGKGDRNTLRVEQRT